MAINAEVRPALQVIVPFGQDLGSEQLEEMGRLLATCARCVLNQRGQSFTPELDITCTSLQDEILEDGLIPERLLAMVTFPNFKPETISLVGENAKCGLIER